jgi:hypothetical protein
MAMQRRRSRAKDLGLYLGVIEESALITDSDTDQLIMSYRMEQMAGQSLVDVCLRRGMAPQFAAGLLRALADRVERHGGILLNLPDGDMGYFDDTGNPESDPLQPDRDDNGDIIFPDIE